MRELVPKAFALLLVFATIYLVLFGVLCTVQRDGTPWIYRTNEYFKWKGGISYQKFQEFDPHRSYDVVFLGSSHAYRGYDPELFGHRGYSAFNLGTSAQSPLNSYFIVKHYLNARNTGLLVFDAYEVAMEIDGMESTMDLSQNISMDRAAVEMALAHRDPRGLNMVTLRAMRSSAEPMYSDSNYRQGGAVILADSVKKELHYQVGKPLDLNPVQMNYLRKIFALCTERKIPLVLVNHYFPKASDREKHRAFNDRLQREMAPFGLKYFDLAYDHQLDDRDHFYDHNHLNAAGARIFNAQLIDLLERDGVLKAP
ncbi:MAG: hypothetical protein KDB88_04650 [Flavobacteriales bacterium]|nr:hypothetical protein [Flavobacteriales bacterium]